MASQIFETIFENNLLTVEINSLATQANGSVLIRYKESVILTVSVSGQKDTILSYFPLTVVYQEKLYAVGKIPGSFTKREGRPSDSEILNSRLIDRTLRPLFPKNFKKEIQIVNTILSSYYDCYNEIFAILTSSLSLLISDIPFIESVSAVCIGRIDNKFIVNPNLDQRDKSDFLLTLSGTKESLNMIEAFAKETPEEVLLEAMIYGHEIIKKLCIFQDEIMDKIDPQKRNIEELDFNKELYSNIKSKYSNQIEYILSKSSQQKQDTKLFKSDIDQLKEQILTEYQNDECILSGDQQTLVQVENIFNDLFHKEFRKMIIKDKKRIDGRRLDEIRPIKSQISLLPRAHGSALFTRGKTQSLSVVTLGTLKESKMIDDLTEEEKRFILHYNFPPFSVGEIGRYMSPSRREIGHGILAEKALFHLLPSEEEFPYSIRVVSEILESNGSSSQATICAASMALMDAGVPLKKLIAGIAMGLFYDNEEYVILSDIQGLEDHEGDMDLKAAGTKKGITALQMDIKIKNINFDILKELLNKARIGRIEILEKMNLVITDNKKEVSVYAPKVKVINIQADKIRDIIGTGGKIISRIIEKYDNVQIDIKQNGKIFINHHNIDIVNNVADYILNLVKDIKVGEVYQVTVLKILSNKQGQSFGAIVEIFPGVEGFIHVSQLADTRTEHVQDVLNIGNKVFVKCIDIDNKGKIFLSLKNYKV
ncbi:polyribonucleotide nucleotidyltransferase [Columbia Basin potato purple top phytoplasma]|uniref:Polyribonucleotide nucleotidyltransferase n=1 Tax=Columbia Basin potato purple top phytoplasma TaxID=307134 RepID=A0ABT5L8U2_9MOLU|nr:polyribonucleotide nucleotidyltransferase [Columbia Basin potato purple top phytoplasma]MDC9032030.1 polyribonucleotide nucleotidyltransferase [Columbia Basin potato purple top phytoplasma]